MLDLRGIKNLRPEFFKNLSRFEKFVVFGVGGLILSVLLFYFLISLKSESSVAANYNIAARGNIQNTISAVGEISALQTVEVGSQLSGQVVDVFVDYNSPVEKDQVVARIDPRTFSSLVAQAKADLNIAQANLEIQKASSEKARTNYENVKKDFERTKELSKQGFASQQGYDKAEQNLLEARENLRIENSSRLRAEAQVEQSKELLQQREYDLLRTEVRSPITGIVIKKEVEVGQTVAASFQAPVLFEIAEDLHKMQVIVSVDEADIAKIREGQKVFFQVDAYPDKTFEGYVEQIRKAGIKKENIVTYTVIVIFGQEEIVLFPGMTASVDIIQFDKQNVLLVPEQAFALGEAYKRYSRSANTTRLKEGWERIWILNGDGKPELRNVLPGVSDDINTEILDGDLEEGEKVVTGAIGGSFAEILEKAN